MAYSGAFAILFPPANHDNKNSETPLQMHIHPVLKIFIDGRQITIPSNIGLNPSLWKDHALDRYGTPDMSPVHTHDNSGTIHVESNLIRNFTLGEFFNMWGVQFNELCVLDKCSEPGGLKMFVNGVPNQEYRNLILRDEALIEIFLTSRKGS